MKMNLPARHAARSSDLIRRVARVSCYVVLTAVAVIASETFAQQTTSAPAIRFNRHIRPILSDHCFQCHGPDRNQRKADLRLDTESGAIGAADQPGVIVRGKPDQSELLRRLTTSDPSERMPPPEHGRPLTERQIELIRAWIAQGAPWEGHWAFRPPQRSLPDVTRLPVAPQARPRSPLDWFVLERLSRESLSPAAEADRATLLRRATLDLTGLPPHPEQVDEFLDDSAPDAFERQIDRLLASPEYGERFGIRWLDAARYADTSGYQSDGPRYMWRWRDWVLDAFNHDRPFDQFTVEQIAGDLLPDATLDQHVATGFNRNHRGNSEGGIIPEEYAVEYVVDRVDTTATVWLGLTMGCARCHEHKFDPISQRDFYRLFAYFNNVPEFGRAIKEGNSPPFIKAPTPFEQEQLAQLDNDCAQAAERLESLQATIAEAQTAWEQSARGAPTTAFDPLRPFGFPEKGLVAHRSFDRNEQTGSTTAPQSEPGPKAVAGQIGESAEFAGGPTVVAGDVAAFGYFDKFSISVWVYPDGTQGGTIVAKMTDVPNGDGYAVRLVEGKVQANFVKRWLDDALRVGSEETIPAGQWSHIAVTYDGGVRNAEGVRIFINGRIQKLQVHLDGLNQTFATKEPLRIGGGGGPDAGFHGRIDEVRVYDRLLTAAETLQLATPDHLADIVAIPAEKRSEGQRLKLDGYFLDHHAPPVVKQARETFERISRQRETLFERISTVMVMREMPTPRDTFVLRRGEYDQPGEKVEPGIPESLGALPAAAPNNRLGFARWLVDPANPLTGRVAVNRLWQALFGIGLVKTTEDLGSQGEPPSHPELLDWLANELRERGWSVKRLTREIVTSHTYRQSSDWTPQAAERDPDNRLLARGPRFRLPAEMIRDQALALGGLLVKRVGGPSVKPYQPADLWKELATDSDYQQGRGTDLYRRSLYTFWKRTVAPPTMVTFDSPGREACVVRETRTNTPLQALTLLNEVTFVEAARSLAERTLRDGGDADESRLQWAFRQVTSRRPSPDEQAILQRGLAVHRTRYRGDMAAAKALIEIGESRADARLDPAELAAFTSVMSVLLNLDEVVTKH